MFQLFSKCKGKVNIFSKIVYTGILLFVCLIWVVIFHLFTEIV